MIYSENLTNRELLNKAMPLISLSRKEWNVLLKFVAELEQKENELYSQKVPITSNKAVKQATKALKGSQESTTTDEEEKLILPDFLKIN